MDWDKYLDMPNRNWWPGEEAYRFRGLLNGGSRVLDVGCGTGANVWYLECEDCDCVGLDITHRGLLEARTYLEGKRRCLDVPLVQGSGIDLPFQDASFDGVLDIVVSQHFSLDDRVRAYKEAYRVLKPGGWHYLKTWASGDANGRYAGHFPELTYVSTRSLVHMLEQAGFMVGTGYMSRSPNAYAHHWLDDAAMWHIAESRKPWGAA